ncbi:hypothetical protein G3480_16475 [Thiorhodococcus mannitoliphagus]|uniref:Uncharacterized protein n=1 Tax=Thiorhodococcus mannitoliphagus TaxID=329406 RepID=A0A6P1DXT0_9GAMM|nr:hypothetical protein [Thiorhodococcus mannitoliphagus]NEX21883.1 hypothetical protein [Thiorhodococcus mannitoliphagus]
MSYTANSMAAFLVPWEDIERTKAHENPLYFIDSLHLQPNPGKLVPYDR